MPGAFSRVRPPLFPPLERFVIANDDRPRHLALGRIGVTTSSERGDGMGCTQLIPIGYINHPISSAMENIPCHRLFFFSTTHSAVQYNEQHSINKLPSQ